LILQNTEVGMLPVFLIGGGGDYPERDETYGRFLRAATSGDNCRVALVSAADTAAEAEVTFISTCAVFLALGMTEADIAPIFLLPGVPLTPAMLTNAQPTGVFVCGGMTPLYQQLLCEDRDWLGYLESANIPYGGVSAGAAVAATTAIVGGWRAQRGDRIRPILYEGAGEGLDLLDVRPGLGLVPFTVEIHASQWGTLTRLLHAIDLGFVTEGWAIDENTLLQSDGDGLQVYGAGQAYHLWRDEPGTRVTIHSAPGWVTE
jgi:cyanophycinase